MALHWDGAIWTVAATPVHNDDSQFWGLTVLSSLNVVAVGQSAGAPSSVRWDGTQWHVVPTPPVLDDLGFLWAMSERDGSAWAVGYQGFGNRDRMI